MFVYKHAYSNLDNEYELIIMNSQGWKKFYGIEVKLLNDLE